VEQTFRRVVFQPARRLAQFGDFFPGPTLFALEASHRLCRQRKVGL
jgi:hypothetical protein